jgi:2-oxo-4-hydroxy-4-carboxy-5-ureidoimidazoline decarboxylase
MKAQIDDRLLNPRPSAMSRDAFVAAYGRVYEHSPWVAEQLHDAGLTVAHETVSGLASAMAAIVAATDDAAKHTLIRAHPDLAGKAAVAGNLTAESRSEQAGAGLDQCSAEEFAEFQRLNGAYQKKFGFPFIIAVSGLDRHAILDAFRVRLQNDQRQEFAEALRQIDRIAAIRIAAKAGPAAQ